MVRCAGESRRVSAGAEVPDPKLRGDAARDKRRDLSQTALFLAGLFVILMCHLVWATWNDASPVWDMAYHQLQGYRYLESWRSGLLLAEFARLSPQYPPLYYLVEAFFLRLSPGTHYLAFLSNLPALILLPTAGFLLARSCLPGTQAALAGLLPLLFPMMAWASRESLLDVLLAGWVSAAGFLIVRSGFFQSLRWTLLFGAVSAAGVLTKWTFPVYLAVPVLFALWKTPNRLLALRNLLLAGMLSLPVALTYYGPNLSQLFSRYPTTQQTGWIPWKPFPRHGEPGLDNILGWVYYPRTLAGYFLFLPLLAGLVAGCLRRKRKSAIEGCQHSFAWFWLVGGMALLTFVTPKDPRFILPLAVPLGLVLLIVWSDKSWMVRALVTIAFLQFLSVSFPMPFGAVKWALFERKDDTDFQSLQQEWVLYESEYFGVAGPPSNEKWPYDKLLGELAEGAAVGFLPDLPRFHSEGLALEAAREHRLLHVFRLGVDEGWRNRLGRADYLVGKSGYQGISFTTGFNDRVVEAAVSESWVSLGEWSLPDGSRMWLWQHPGS